MRRILGLYLAQSYQRNVMNKPVSITPLTADPDLVAEIKAEIARIDQYRLGANLVSRDFVAYQNRRALVRLLEELETTATLKMTEGADKANFGG